MSDFQLSLLCLLVTLGLYFANKRLYRRFHKLPLMPLVFTPILLVMILVFGHISYQRYMGETHWLLWLLGPATIAFAVPVYDNLAIIKRHWMSLTAGVTTASVVAVTSSVWLARLFTLPDEIQRSLAVRSVTTPFALAAAKPLGGQPDLVALFVVVTGVFGMAVGDVLFLRLSIREGIAKGAGLGAASHGAGTARSYEIGPQEGVVASLVMMLSGVVMVLACAMRDSADSGSPWLPVVMSTTFSGGYLLISSMGISTLSGACRYPSSRAISVLETMLRPLTATLRPDSMARSMICCTR